MKLTGGDLVVKALEEHGVTHVFGLPGDTSMALYDAFRNNPRVQHVMVKDERSSAYMADAYAKVTGRPGVCEGPSGGGALYILPGVSEAEGSRVPIVCMTTDIPLSSDDRGSLTHLDQAALFKPMTRFTTRILMAEKVPESVARAFRYATASRQGASHLALPESMLAQELDGDRIRPAAQKPSTFPAHRYLPPQAEIELAASWLEQAQRPVIFCGGGFNLSRAWEALEKLQELSSIPAVMNINGKGAVDETKVTGLGVVGGNGGKTACNQSVRDADLVLVLGSRLNSTATAGGYILGQGPRIIQVDLDSGQIGNTHPVDLALVGDVAGVLEALVACLQDRGIMDAGRHRAWTQLCKERVEAEMGQYEPLFSSDAFPFKPHRVMRALERTLPTDSILVVDAGTPTPYVTAFYRPPAAGRLFIAGRCHGSLGFALPAAIGAQVGGADRTVLALFGDGSFGMVLGELETVARYQLPLVMIAFRNRCYSWIKCLQDIYYQERYHGVDFPDVADFCAVARAFGIHAERPGSGRELENALIRAVDSRKPAFIEVVVECMTREVPPVHAWKRDSQVPREQRKRASY